MNDPTPKQRVVIYIRDVSGDGPDQVHLIGKPRPPQLQQLMRAAAQDGRDFDVVVVHSPPVLGRPEQVQDIVHEFAAMGVQVEYAHRPAASGLRAPGCGRSRSL